MTEQSAPPEQKTFDVWTVDTEKREAHGKYLGSRMYVAIDEDDDLKVTLEDSVMYVPTQVVRRLLASEDARDDLAISDVAKLVRELRTRVLLDTDVNHAEHGFMAEQHFLLALAEIEASLRHFEIAAAHYRRGSRKNAGAIADA